MNPLLPTLVAFALATTGSAMAQELPVKTYRQGKIFQGNTRSVIPVPQDPTARYSLLNAYKVARRPWADIVVRRDNANGTWFISRTYRCDQGIYRELGEGDNPRILSENTSPDQSRAQRLQPGTIEYSIARYACGL
jgi:hypothetical protein